MNLKATNQIFIFENISDIQTCQRKILNNLISQKILKINVVRDLENLLCVILFYVFVKRGKLINLLNCYYFT